jgi:aspartate aminotransferase
MWESKVSAEWKKWIEPQESTKWLSDRMKRSILPDYGSLSQSWGRTRLAQIKNQIDDVADLSPGTQRGYTRPPEFLMAALLKGLDKHSYEYVKAEKLSEAKNLLAENYNKKYGLEIDSGSELTITVGASSVLDAFLRVFVNPDDEVVIFDPDYATYEAQAANYCKNIVPVKLKETSPGKWQFDIEELEKNVTNKTKVIMISNANNPTSYLYTKEDNESILELAEKYDFYILSDQVSEEIKFDGADYNSIAELPNAMERTIICSSISKMYCLSGLRTGWAIADKKFIEKINSIVGWTTDGIASLGVDALIALHTNKKETNKFVKEALESLKNRRDYMNNRLSKMDGVIPNNPTGLYWAFPNVKSFGVPTQQLAEFLLKESKVFCRPGTWYGREAAEGHFRLSFCVAPSIIEKAMDRMESGLTKFRELNL